jgi:AraC-like DNA-binding protein
MTYNHRKVFDEINESFSENPMAPLYSLSQRLECSHPVIEKAVLLNTSLSFRDYRKQKLLERILARLKEGHSRKDISKEIGYRWPEHLSRFIRAYTGQTLMQIKREFKVRQTRSE